MIFFFFFPFHSVILSLEVKLHLLHSYMNVKWIPLSSDAQVKATLPPSPFLCVFAFSDRKEQNRWCLPSESVLSGS
jgi:hypothetical protein